MTFFMNHILVPCLVFIGGYVLLRFAGKRAVKEMNSFDLLFVIILGTVLSGPLTTEQVPETLLHGLMLLAIFLAFTLLSLSNRWRWLLITSPTVLIRDGDIDEQGLRRAKMTTASLIGKMRQKGYPNLNDVELAMMEDIGDISVIPKSYARPLQPSDIQLHPSPTFIPIPVIMNGEILDHNLKYLGKDRDWLDSQLNAWETNIDDIADITLATVNEKSSLVVDFDDTDNLPKDALHYKPGNQN